MKKLIVFFIFVFSIGCQDSNKVDQTMKKIYETADTQSALVSIDSLKEYTNRFTEEQLNRYILYSTLVKDKNGQNISNDSLIFQTIDFFKEDKDYFHLGLAYFYSGRVLSAQNNLTGSFQYYLEAEDYINRTDDNRLKGLLQYFIGHDYISQEYYAKALNKYLKALDYFEKANEKAGEYEALLNIGLCYAYMDDKENSIDYYEQAFAQAEKIGDEGIIYTAAINRGVIYNSFDMYDEAKADYLQALELAQNSADSVQTYIYLSNLAFLENNDSSLEYLIQAENIIDSSNIEVVDLLGEVYRARSQYAESKSNYKEALALYKHYVTLMGYNFKEQYPQLVELEDRYNLKKIEGEKYEAIIAKQRTQILLVVLGFVITSLFLILRTQMRKMKRYAEESERKIDLFEELAEKYTTLDKSYNSLLVDKDKEEKEEKKESKGIALEVMTKYFDILTKAALLKTYLKAEERTRGKDIIRKFEEVVYGDNSFPWDSFLPTVDEINGNVFSKVKEKYPDLDDEEYKICCLAYCGLSNEDIATIMNKNINTVKAKRLQLRKKLGISGYSNFIEEINTLVDLEK